MGMCIYEPMYPDVPVCQSGVWKYMVLYVCVCTDKHSFICAWVYIFRYM